MGQEAEIGFYSLAQLCTYQETEKQKPRVGIFPWGRTRILGMVSRGEFPAPVKRIGRFNLWPKKVIHEYIKEIEKGECLA